MPRLLVVHPHVTYPGGATTVALITAQELARLGHDVHFVCSRFDISLIQPYDLVKFHALGGPLPSEWRYWLSLPARHMAFDRCAEEIDADVMIAHVFPANYWAFAFRARRPSIRCIWYCHEPSAFVHESRVINALPWPMRAAAWAANPLLQIGDRVLARFADQILVNGPYTAQRVAQVYRRPSRVASPGVDPRRFPAQPVKEQMILAVGHLTKFKRFDLVIRAAALLRDEGLVPRWVVVGDGEDRERLIRLSTRARVADLVAFVGRVGGPELDHYFARARIVVVPSTREPFGMVPIEAMAAGAVVVCSNDGGPAQTVDDGRTGLHFKSGSALDLADKVRRILVADGERRAIVRAARQVVLADYRWSHLVRELDRTVGDLVRE